ncbi:MAG: cytochrome c-type biogenesis protein CcmH [Candidatus Promineifilaceae bacterium]|nr:cytochrome c-type biogenesis protein CcmH [Candidatus Promineifilaceae bacterium]
MNQRNEKLTIVLLLLLALLCLAIPAVAQEPVTDDEVNEVARDLYCPTCENRSVDVCPTDVCADWREDIRQQLAAGRSESEIHAYFAERYGNSVLAAPPREGINWLAWIVPIVVVVVGALLFGRYLKGLRAEEATEDDDTIDVAQSTAPVPPPAADEDDYISRVEKEVREGE